jgi:hypothetical protein
LRRKGRTVLIALCVAAGGCAGPVRRLPTLDKTEVEAEQRREQIAQMRDYYAQLHRIDTVAFRIRVANRHFCDGWESAQIGVHAVTPRSLPRRYRSFVSEALDIGWMRPTAISVVEASPAAAAGIRNHDEIIALNGELIPLTGTAGWMGIWLKRNGEKPVRVDFRRDGKDFTVTVTPVIGCAIPIEYVIDEGINAYTDDEKIVIQSGIAALAKTDAQLAVIIGHELAHVYFGHRRKTLFNVATGTIAGGAIDAGLLLGGISTGGAFRREFAKGGLRAYSVAFERESDYAGGYFAARAGYDLAGAEEIWSAMGLHHPASLRFAGTHPLAPVRFVQMKQVAAEIEDKRRKHLPLVPDAISRQAAN